MNTIIFLIFQLVVLIFSVIIHEVSHGFVAEYLGDPTARLAGRLTLNPLKHLELFGSVILPLTLYVVSGGTFIFGWAKPVPYNPFNLKNPLKGGALIGLAGPSSNFLIAVIFGLSVRVLGLFGIPFDNPIYLFFGLIVYVNILLAVFNLVPLAPLDGSKVLYALLPKDERGREIMIFLERYGLFLLLIFIFFGFGILIPLIDFLFKLFTGLPAFV